MKPEVQDYQKKKGIVMKEFTKKLIENFPNTKFRFYTNSSFDPKLTNVIIK
ncbi:hypothetical protein OAA09_00335 [bacterium]|nr:hypothetical protein [bacterium]